MNAVLTNLNLKDGDVTGANDGGAILNSGTLTVSNCHASPATRPTTTAGGGIENDEVADDVLANDSSAHDLQVPSAAHRQQRRKRDGQRLHLHRRLRRQSGGAISNEDRGTLTLSGSTFSAERHAFGGASTSKLRHGDATRLFLQRQ